MNKDQENAFRHILTSKDSLTGIQGYAGVGKTYMIQAVKEFQQSQGKDNLIGLAPTNQAVSEMSKDSGIESHTIDSYILKNQDKTDELKRNQIYIVDESSMLDSQKLAKLTKIAEATDSKIVLIGDKDQFTSIGAGATFEHLQKHSMQTAEVKESMRAKTDELKKIYADLKEYKTEKILDTLEKNNNFIQTDSKDQIVKDYLQDKENTALLTGTNQDRRELNELVREQLKESAELKNHQDLQIQESLRLDDISAHHASSYQEATHIYVSGNIKGLNVGKEYQIEAINTETNQLKIQNKGESFYIDLSKDGEKLQAFKSTQKEFSEGDQIIFSKKHKDPKIANGDRATISKIVGNKITVKTKKKEVQFNLKEYSSFDHAYATTAYKAQGQTYKKSLLWDSGFSDFRALNVSITRAKYLAKIYTPDKETFRSRVANKAIKKSTLDYLTLEREVNRNDRARETIQHAERATKDYNRDVVRDFEDLKKWGTGRERASGGDEKHKSKFTKFKSKLQEIAQNFYTFTQNLLQEVRPQSGQEPSPDELDIKEIFENIQDTIAEIELIQAQDPMLAHLNVSYEDMDFSKPKPEPKAKETAKPKVEPKPKADQEKEQEKSQWEIDK